MEDTGFMIRASQPEIIVCASGKSTRFTNDKLLHPLVNNKSILQTTLENIVQHTHLQCSVVIPPGQDDLLRVVNLTGANPLVMQPASNGLGETIAFAVKHFSHAVGWMICLADMPFISPAIYREIGEQFPLNKIIAPSYQNRQGHPVYFPKRFYPELIQLTGDKGGSAIVKRNQSDIRLLPVDESSVIEDIDSVSDLELLNKKYFGLQNS